MTNAERARSAAERMVGGVDAYQAIGQRVPDWILQKDVSSGNLTESEYYAIGGAFSSSVTRETQKAVQVTYETEYGRVRVWAPKSVIRTPEQARADAIDAATRDMVNSGYNTYLNQLNRSSGTNSRYKKWDRLTDAMRQNGVQVQTRDEWANSRRGD